MVGHTLMKAKPKFTGMSTLQGKVMTFWRREERSSNRYILHGWQMSQHHIKSLDGLKRDLIVFAF